MHSRRPITSVLLVAFAIALVVGIVAGQRLGDRVLLNATQRSVPLAGPLATPVGDPTDSTRAERYWKRLQVVSVATDPAFPDPRVTPSPSPPTPKPATPAPRHTSTGSPATPENHSTYTSPPLPLPIASHAPEETSGEPTLSPEGRANVPASERSGQRPTATPIPTPLQP